MWPTPSVPGGGPGERRRAGALLRHAMGALQVADEGAERRREAAARSHGVEAENMRALLHAAEARAHSRRRAWFRARSSSCAWHCKWRKRRSSREERLRSLEADLDAERLRSSALAAVAGTNETLESERHAESHCREAEALEARTKKDVGLPDAARGARSTHTKRRRRRSSCGRALTTSKRRMRSGCRRRKTWERRWRVWRIRRMRRGGPNLPGC